MYSKGMIWLETEHQFSTILTKALLHSLGVEIDKPVDDSLPHQSQLFFSFYLDVLFDMFLPTKELDHADYVQD